MGMWEEDDTSTRWIHGVCGILLVLFAIFLLSLMSAPWYAGVSPYNHATETEGAVCAGSLYFAARLLWYAATGRNCLNRDDYD